MIVPVTPRLAEQLGLTQSSLNAVKDKTLNDRDHFHALTGRMEQLTLALLAAPGSVPITADVAPCASFDMGPETVIGRSVEETVEYLRDTVRPIVRSGEQLGQYKGDKAIEAHDHLRYLFARVCRSIEAQARVDLEALAAKHGIGCLIESATVLADTLALSKWTPGPMPA